MQNDMTILGGIDPEITERIASRREAIGRGAAMSSGMAAALALGSIPVALAALSRNAFAQGTPADVQAVIDFALMLEIFENEFYKAVLGTSDSAVQNTAFAAVRAMVPATALPAFQQIQEHEAEHVQFLLNNGAVNTLNLDAGSFDFTGGRGSG
ncbi:MAG TPA: ferritin-like domain-containing protein, partial [Burkholderiales bacterium]|nr:ferritin-like domain-containing protein [Burkholderiales bacterium]